MIDFNCPECGEELHSPDSRKGRVEVCPECGALCVVPGCAVSQQIPAGVTYVFSINDYTLSVSRKDIHVTGPDWDTAEEIARNTVRLLATPEGQTLVTQFSNGPVLSDRVRARQELGVRLGVPPTLDRDAPARSAGPAEPVQVPGPAEPTETFETAQTAEPARTVETTGSSEPSVPPSRTSRAPKRQRLLIQKAGVYASNDLTRQEAEETIAQLVHDRRLTDEDVANAWRLEEPTRRQVEYLTELGVFTPPGTTRGDAADMIEYRKQTIPLSGNQREFIERLNGVAGARMTVQVAEQYIDYLLQHQPTCVNCRCQYPPGEDGLCTVCGAAVPTGQPIRLPADLRASKMAVKIPKLWKKVKGLLRRKKPRRKP